MPRRFRDLPLVSIALVSINIVVFFLSLLQGDVWHYLGGVHRTSILIQHEYARLLWAMFLHDGTAHLFNNMIILFFLGAMLEQETGHICVTVIYFLSGIGGNVLSLVQKVMTGSNTISIGASGAVFGLDGLLLALVLFAPGYKDKVSPVRVLLMIVLSLNAGFMGGNVDNAGHIGGLAVGFLAGSVFVLARNLRDKKAQNRRAQSPQIY